MPDVKITDMTTATQFAGSDVLPIVQSGSNKKLTATALFSKIQDPVVINSESEDNDTVIKGQTDAALFYVDASTDRVGISTNAPETVLDVDGSFQARGLTRFPSANTMTSGGAIDVTTGSTIVDSLAPLTIQIPAGVSGQKKTIYRKSTGTLSLSPGAGVTIIGAASITFDSVGSSLTLHYLGGNWYIHSASRCTFA